jgi:hypothetical protein
MSSPLVRVPAALAHPGAAHPGGDAARRRWPVRSVTPSDCGLFDIWRLEECLRIHGVLVSNREQAAA